MPRIPQDPRSAWWNSWPFMPFPCGHLGDAVLKFPARFPYDKRESCGGITFLKCGESSWPSDCSVVTFLSNLRKPPIHLCALSKFFPARCMGTQYQKSARVDSFMDCGKKPGRVIQSVDEIAGEHEIIARIDHFKLTGVCLEKSTLCFMESSPKSESSLS